MRLRPLGCGTWACRGVSSSVGGGNLSKGSQSIFTRVSEKTTENSECLDGQAQTGIEPVTTHFKSKKLNSTLHQAKIDEHECEKIAECTKNNYNIYLFFPYSGVYL